MPETEPVRREFERLPGSNVQGLRRAVKALVDSGQSRTDVLTAVDLD